MKRNAGKDCYISKIGKNRRKMKNMKNVDYVPRLQWNLMSMRATMKIGNQVEVNTEEIVARCGTFQVPCRYEGGLYVVPVVY